MQNEPFWNSDFRVSLMHLGPTKARPALAMYHSEYQQVQHYHTCKAQGLREEFGVPAMSLNVLGQVWQHVCAYWLTLWR